MSVQSKELCEFGPFRFDRADRTLWRDGHIVPLTPKALDTLAALVETPGRLLEKEELIQAVWPDTFVEEGNLAVQISLLRKTFGDDSYIETVPRRGYRFVAPVRDVALPGDPQPAPDGPAAIALDTVPAAPTRRWMVAAGAAAIASGAAAVWGVRRSSVPNNLPSSLAVLPFQILNGQTDDQMLGVGLADAVIALLGGNNRFVVRPTSAVRKFDQSQRDPVAAGASLGVEAVLDATVQLSAGRVRLNAALLRVRDGRRLWADTFDLSRADLFTLEDQLSARIAGSLSGESLRYSAYRPSPEAHRLYTLGQYHRNRWSTAGNRKAIEYAEQAIAIDPRYAAAHALRAQAWSMLGYFFGVAPREAYPQADESVQTALSLDDQLADAHHVSGASRLFYHRDFAAAGRHLRRSLQLSPNHPDSLQVMGLLLAVQHKNADGISYAHRALEVDPTSAWRYVGTAAQYAYANQIPAAIEEEKKAHELDPALAAPFGDLFNQYTVLGDHRNAVDWLVRMYQRPGADSAAGAALREAFDKRGLRAFQELRLRQLLDRHAPPIAIAQACTFMGRRDEAMQWLEQADEDRQSTVLFINIHPMYASLRDHPRFQALVRKIGL